MREAVAAGVFAEVGLVALREAVVARDGPHCTMASGRVSIYVSVCSLGSSRLSVVLCLSLLPSLRTFFFSCDSILVCVRLITNPMFFAGKTVFSKAYIFCNLY